MLNASVETPRWLRLGRLGALVGVLVVNVGPLEDGWRKRVAEKCSCEAVEFARSLDRRSYNSRACEWRRVCTFQ